VAADLDFSLNFLKIRMRIPHHGNAVELIDFGAA